MQRSSKEEVFVREFVMWVGFCGGLFASAGVDPEGEIIKALISILQTSPFVAQLLAVSISTAITLISLHKAYSLGGKLGILAIVIAFISGYIISSSPLFGVFLLFFAIFLAKIASKGNLSRF